MSLATRLSRTERAFGGHDEPPMPEHHWFIPAECPEVPLWAIEVFGHHVHELHRRASQYTTSVTAYVSPEGAVFAEAGWQAFGHGWYLVTPEGLTLMDGLPVEVNPWWEEKRRKTSLHVTRSSKEYPLVVQRDYSRDHDDEDWLRGWRMLNVQRRG